MTLDPRPRVLTYDIFGTVLDWRRGHIEEVAARGGRLTEAGFDAVIDCQGELEADETLSYAEVVARSLTECVGLDAQAGLEIGEQAGSWPLFADSRDALARISDTAPCVAMTNSDAAHRTQVQAQLGYDLAAWVCAQEIGHYKPNAAFWHATALRLAAAGLGGSLDRTWWHVSAYADYDLETAGRLGLTRVYVARPHARPGPADVRVPDLAALAELVGG